jgi:hypothetical protein
MPIIGIRDGSSDGWFSWGLTVTNLTGRKLDAYRPRHIAEITDQDWKSWQEFIGNHNNYTGRSMGAWEMFWDSFTHGPFIGDEWPTLFQKLKDQGKI